MLATDGRIWKGRRDNVSEVLECCKVLGICHDRMCLELIGYSRHNVRTECHLFEEPAILKLLPVELLRQLGIAVLAFQETDVYDIDRARCTATDQFRNQEFRNDWGWVQAGSVEMYPTLRGHLTAKLVPLFKIGDCRQETVLCLAGVLMLSSVNSGWPSNIHSLFTVPLREDAPEFTLMEIGKFSAWLISFQRETGASSSIAVSP